MILGIIPARGGSKGIPRKNLYPFDGKPLIKYTIQAARESILDDLVISSDDEEILEYHRGIIRPAALAADDSPTIDAVLYTVLEYEKTGKTVDIVVVLQPTSPLRTTADINQAITGFLKSGRDCGVSVTKGIHPIKSYDEHGRPFVLQTPYDKHKHICYTRNGAIFITKKELLMKGKLFDYTPYLYEMPKLRSIDIDDYDDLIIAEALRRYWK